MLSHAFLVIHSFCWAYTPFEIPYDPKCFAGNYYYKGQVVYVDRDEWAKYKSIRVYPPSERKSLYRKWKKQFFKNVKPFREIRLEK